MGASAHGFCGFLERSLALLATHAKPAYAEVVRRLGAFTVAVEVDGVCLAIAARDGRIDVQPGPPASPPDAHARTGRAALMDLLEGRVDLVQAVWHDAVELQGPLEALLSFYDALRAYFRAAVACPEFAGLLQEYLAPQALEQQGRPGGT